LSRHDERANGDAYSPALLEFAILLTAMLDPNRHAKVNLISDEVLQRVEWEARKPAYHTILHFTPPIF